MSNGKVIAQLENITKDFDGVQILKPTNLSIYEGEFLTFLGPSGCGKTTTLRIIAGLETPTEGTVKLEGRDVTNLPPYKRNVNTVFQNYALFPNMNVFDNVAFGLVEKRLGKAEIREKVDAMLQLVQLGKMGKRKPNQLSGGGQKQRVAIARALANDPKLLLLDEPLGALDLKLRKQMQLELKALQKNLGITFVYVTHDQEEALTMSDRIIVMNNGKFEQIGTPREIYEHPQNKFVANFIGESNIFEASVVSETGTAGTLTLMMENGHVLAEGEGFKYEEIVYLCLRPENIEISTSVREGFTLKGFVRDHVYVGNIVKTVVELPNGKTVQVNRNPHGELIAPGMLVNLFWDPKDAVVMHTREDYVYRILVMVGPSAFWLLLFLAVPLVYVVVMSFCTRGLYGGIQYQLSFASYKSIFSTLYLKVTWKSLLMAFETCVICLLIAYPFSWFLSRVPKRLSGILMLLVILPFWVSALLRLNGWSNILRDSGIVNTLLMKAGIIKQPITMMYTDGAVLFGMVYCMVPFMILPLHTSISKLDGSLIEAAMDLGANRFRTFIRVILPATLPGIFAGTIQVFIPSLGAFFVADVMGGGNSVYLGNLIQNQFLVARNWPLGAAFSVLLIVFTLVMLRLYTRIGSLDDLA